MAVAKKIIFRSLVFIVLTVLSQTGGLIYLVCFPLYKIIDSRFSSVIKKVIVKTVAFSFIYLLLTFTLVPFIAKQFGRIQLPVISSGNLRPLTILTCVLNRNYVRPALKEVAEQTAIKMNEMYPGTIIFYLDAGFPFINK